MARSRGMVQVDGVTYRVDRVAAEYRIVRITDETVIGRFRGSVGTTVVCCVDVDETLARTVAREAIRKGKTVWRASPLTHGAGPLALVQSKRSSGKPNQWFIFDDQDRRGSNVGAATYPSKCFLFEKP